MTKIAMFTGSFDPITNGHMDIIARASKLFDELYIGLFYNKNKQGFWDVETRKRTPGRGCGRSSQCQDYNGPR